MFMKSSTAGSAAAGGVAVSASALMLALAGCSAGATASTESSLTEPPAPVFVLLARASAFGFALASACFAAAFSAFAAAAASSFAALACSLAAAATFSASALASAFAALSAARAALISASAATFSDFAAASVSAFAAFAAASASAFAAFAAFAAAFSAEAASAFAAFAASFSAAAAAFVSTLDAALDAAVSFAYASKSSAAASSEATPSFSILRSITAGVPTDGGIFGNDAGSTPEPITPATSVAASAPKTSCFCCSFLAAIGSRKVMSASADVLESLSMPSSTATYVTLEPSQTSAKRFERAPSPRPMSPVSPSASMSSPSGSESIVTVEAFVLEHAATDSAQPALTKRSLVVTTATVSTPRPSKRSAAFSRPGRWRSEHVGVKAPGMPTNIDLPSPKASPIRIGEGLIHRDFVRSAEGSTFTSGNRLPT
mmetsp:Transcript_50820/g.108512  ORF Transcript_50820/g.108512 Transcript_50820/m.108512 type:complete len:431 (-) Transcript_50820:337-1629(-)